MLINVINAKMSECFLISVPAALQIRGTPVQEAGETGAAQVKVRLLLIR